MTRELPETKLISTLQRIAKSNPTKPSGSGIREGQFIPLCYYHDARLAVELIEILESKEVNYKRKNTRSYVAISVAFEDRETAFQILTEFRKTHPDVRARGLSRDFDHVFVIGFMTVLIAAIAYFVPTLGRFVPIAVLTTGFSFAVLGEHLHRRVRFGVENQFSLFELVVLTTICAANLAIWRLAL